MTIIDPRKYDDNTEEHLGKLLLPDGKIIQLSYSINLSELYIDIREPNGEYWSDSDGNAITGYYDEDGLFSASVEVGHKHEEVSESMFKELYK